MRAARGCGTIATPMRFIDADLQLMIERAAAAGIGMDDIEHDLIGPANLPADEHDALWLYALGRRERPSRRTITIVGG